MAMGRRVLGFALLALVLALTFAGGWVAARMGMGGAVPTRSLTDLEREFTASMQGISLVGFFTVDGRTGRTPVPDRYDFTKVEKIGDDLWRISARMRHGDTDVTLPFAVPMRWVGDTPIIMMTDYTMPSMGTFTVRLFFYGDRYAGTWQHGETGGHMYGRIERTNTVAQDSRLKLKAWAWLER
jgi:hypothetical protein